MPRVLAFAVFVSGCCPNPWPLPDHRQWCVADSWYRANLQDHDLVEIDREHVAVVGDESQAEAQAMLEHVSALSLTPETARRFVDGDLPGEGPLVLLRGVVLNPHSSGFSVYVRGRTVAVHHDCLGSDRPHRMQRRAIVARLPAIPDDVFATCFIVAE